MFPRSRQDGRVHIIALAVLGLFILGLAAWYVSWRRTPTAAQVSSASAPPVAAMPDTSSDAPIDQALGAARRATGATIDSTAYKNRWLDEVRGMDLGGLPGRQKELFLRYANAQHCTCGCGYTLAGCKASDMSCEISGGRLEALLDSVRTGRITSARGVRARPKSSG
ncbi:MAG TPA: hypothetical protein VL332_09370 [Candidatus Saccharimonadaceae bacterium]|jgi:hypothetical protein|nr:hypothetical protein [Candidatus Saccharimonadaceae bacterium]